MRPSDAGDECVRLARLPAHVHLQNRGVADAESPRERPQTLLERSFHGFEAIEKRQNVERDDDVAGDEERQHAEARKPRPTARRAPDGLAEQRRQKCAQGAPQQRTLRVLAEPAPARLIAQTEAALERVRFDERCRQIGDGRNQREGQEEERRAQPRRAAHRCGIERSSEGAERKGGERRDSACGVGDLETAAKRRIRGGVPIAWRRRRRPLAHGFDRARERVSGGDTGAGAEQQLAQIHQRQIPFR